MKNKTLIKVALSVFFSVGIIASISPTFTLYRNEGDEAVVQITHTPDAPTITYRLVTDNEIQLTASYTESTGILSSSSTGDSFDLTLSGGNYVPNWSAVQKTIYVPRDTTFTWYRYENGSNETSVGTTTINEEGIYTVNPTLNSAGTTTNLGAAQVRKATYLSLTNFNSWGDGNAWFGLYYWTDSGNSWIKGYKTEEYFYRYFTPSTGVNGLKFERLRPSTADGYSNTNNGLNFTNTWDSSGDLTRDNLCYYVKGWSNYGAWGTK